MKKPENPDIHGDCLGGTSAIITHFLKNVASTPNATAIIAADRPISYKTLYADIIGLKIKLEALQLNRVVVCLPRTPRLISLLMALIWLKITWIPVDKAMPPERLRNILEDSGADALCFDSPDAANFENFSCHLIDINTINKFVSKHFCRNEDDLAYIIYTSGSTGKPKGVGISYDALDNFLTDMSSRFLLKNAELLLAITTIGFDISILELFLPLWNGKTILLADDNAHKDPEALIALLKAWPVTLLQATPTMWKMLEAFGFNTNLVALCGGEKLTDDLKNSLLEKTSSLWNMYGPTEATVWCALKKMEKGESITIGRPIRNLNIYVLDENFNPLPPFVKGELYISGTGLAKGYVNNPGLTHERFFMNPKNAQERLYRVGDIACTTNDGEFIIYGRVDNQIKLRGFRIELEEIEAQIQAVEGIRQAAVLLVDEQLIAFIVHEKPLDFSDKKTFYQLAERLPEYMLPNRFLSVEKLPLSSNGKVDRKALANLSIITKNTPTNQPVLNDVQSSLIAIWSTELKRQNISIDDNFFSLGGHSLSAARIVSDIREKLGKKIDLKTFYKYATIKNIANFLEKKSGNADPEKRLESWTLKKLPLNDFQLLLWISLLYEPGLKRYNLVERRRYQGLINKKALDAALHFVYQKQTVLSYRIGQFMPAQNAFHHCAINWLETSLINKSLMEVENCLTASISMLFNEQKWSNKSPLIMAKIFYISETLFEIQVAISHLIVDEDSMAIFFQDLIHAYNVMIAKGTLPLLNENADAFQSQLLNEHFEQKKNVDQDSFFWKKYLKNASLFYFPDTVILNRQKNCSSYFEISDSILQKLRQMVRKYQLTYNDILSAAIALTLQKIFHAPAQNLLINIVKSTRNNAKLDNLMGCFLKIQPIKLYLRKNLSLIDLAKEAQSAALETADYQTASSLVKLSSIGKIPQRKGALFFLLISFFAAIFARFNKMVHPGDLKSSLKLAQFDRRNHFLINLNIYSNFINEDSKYAEPEGLERQKIPAWQYPFYTVESVFDLCFFKDVNQDKLFVSINSNLQPSFREVFGKALLNLIEEALV